MREIKDILISIAASAAATLFTGILNSTPAMLTGATWFGYPATWLRRLVIAPQYNPWRVDVTGLAIDLIFWFLIWLVILSAARRAKKR